MNYSSGLVRGAEWLPPVNESLLVQGAQQDKANADKASSAITSQLDALNALPTVGGADEQIKQQAIKKLSDSVNGLALNDLSNTNIQAQIKSNINSIVANPDFQNVIKRGAQDQQKMKKFVELTAKGEQLAPENMEYLKQKQDYLSKGVYLKEADLSGDIYANADMAKFWESVNKAYTARTGFDTTKIGTGIYEQGIEEKHIEGLKNLAKSMMQGDPQVQGQIQRGMKMNFENINFQDNAIRDANEGIKTTNTLIAQVNHFLSENPNASAADRLKAQLILKSSTEERQQHIKELISPNAQFQKQREEKDYLDKIVEDNMQGYAYHNIKSQKMDENYKMMRELNDKIYEHQTNKLFDITAEGALALDTPIDPTKPLSLADRQKAINKKQSMELELAQAKSDITEQRQKDLIDYKDNPTTAAKAWSVLKSNGEGDFVSVIPSLKSGVWDDKGEVEENATVKAQTYSKELAKKLAVDGDFAVKSVSQNPNDKTKLDIEFDTGWTDPNHIRNIHKTISATDFVNIITDKELSKLGYDVSGRSAKTGAPTAAPVTKPQEVQYQGDSVESNGYIYHWDAATKTYK